MLTLFPEMIERCLHTSILGRAMDSGTIALHAVNIRDYTLERHGKVDDYPYGGGAGMLMQAQPVYDAYLAATEGRRIRTVYVTPQGKPFTQRMAKELSEETELVFLCGHYEGIDERVLEEIVTDRVSVGDYVLTGGELAAMVMIDAVSRLVPGVLGNGESARTESFHNDLLEYPQYSRPEIWRGRAVPEVLLSGNHKDIEKWRLERSRELTARVRPELYDRYQRKQAAIERLSRHKREHIHMMEALRSGSGELLWLNGESAMVFCAESGSLMMTAAGPEDASEMMSYLEREALQERKEPGRFLVCQEFLAEALKERFEAGSFLRFVQAVYTRGEPLPVRHKDIRVLTEVQLPFLSERCASAGAGALAGISGSGTLIERLRSGSLFGAYEKERLAGFIGIDADGAMDCLYVEEGFRRQGFGASLEAFLINRIRAAGGTPYCRIAEGNEAALRLQEKLGLYLSAGRIWAAEASRGGL